MLELPHRCRIRCRLNARCSSRFDWISETAEKVTYVKCSAPPRASFLGPRTTGAARKREGFRRFPAGLPATRILEPFLENPQIGVISIDRFARGAVFDNRAEPIHVFGGALGSVDEFTATI